MRVGLQQRQIIAHLRSLCFPAARPRFAGPRVHPSSHPRRVLRLLRTSPAAMGSADFSGSSVADLDAWLRSHGVDTSLYGTGPSKPLELLLKEVEEGETVLTAGAAGAQRAVSVVNVRLRNSDGQALYEAAQVLPTGARRERNLPLSEKMLPGEGWRDAAARGVREELRTVLPPGAEVVLDEGSYVRTEESKESQSYPQLRTQYVCHRVDARVEGLPQGSFETVEERADGTLRLFWEWR